MLYPLLWMLGTSLKSDREIFSYPFSTPGYEHVSPADAKWVGLQWRNYANAWTRVPFLNFYINSTIVTGLAVLGQTITSTLVAYGEQFPE